MDCVVILSQEGADSIVARELRAEMSVVGAKKRHLKIGTTG
jgi:hypothetical protein